MSGEVAVVVSRHGVDRLRKGHVWVYRSDVRAPSELRGGEVVRLEDERGHFLGRAFYGKTSQISVRLLTREEEPVDEEFFARRLSGAKALRDATWPDPERRRAARVVHGESDLLPGLIVDRYADVLSVQTLIEATEARREMFASLLEAQWSPRAIVERNDAKVRAHEGLPLRKGMLRGSPPGPVEFLEGEVRLVADPLEGQKTGAFLDQAENRIEAGRYAHGRALDCFTYGGAFALQLARRAERVLAVDISEDAAALGREAARRTGAGNVEFLVANAFDYLKDQVDEGSNSTPSSSTLPPLRRPAVPRTRRCAVTRRSTCAPSSSSHRAGSSSPRAAASTSERRSSRRPCSPPPRTRRGRCSSWRSAERRETTRRSSGCRRLGT